MKKSDYSKETAEKKNHNGDNSSDSLAAFDDTNSATQSSEVGTRKKRSKKLTIIISIFMILLLLTGIVVTFLLVDEYNKPQGNPTATITLSDGKQLKFYIFEDTAPIAASNFMFLSLSGYFDGTVIHDNQNDWLRFMGMTDYSTHRSEDESFVQKFKGFDIYDHEWAVANNKNIFWYRLSKDTNSLLIDFNKESNNEGLLCFMRGYSSSLFQISCEVGANTYINTAKRDDFVVFGRYANAKTLEYLRALNGKETEFNKPWYNPKEVIKIESIKIGNYDKTKWHGNKFTGKKGIMDNFDSHMKDLNGYSSHASNYINNL